MPLQDVETTLIFGEAGVSSESDQSSVPADELARGKRKIGNAAVMYVHFPQHDASNSRGDWRRLGVRVTGVWDL